MVACFDGVALVLCSHLWAQFFLVYGCGRDIGVASSGHVAIEGFWWGCVAEKFRV